MNHFTLLGRLTRDCETKIVGGTTLVTGSLAFSSKYKDKSGQMKEDTSYFEFQIWGKTAEAFIKFHAKGDLALLEGSLKQQRWEDNDGKKHGKVLLNIDRWHFVGGKKFDSSQPDSYSANDEDIPF